MSLLIIEEGRPRLQRESRGKTIGSATGGEDLEQRERNNSVTRILRRKGK